MKKIAVLLLGASLMTGCSLLEKDTQDHIEAGMGERQASEVCETEKDDTGMCTAPPAEEISDTEETNDVVDETPASDAETEEEVDTEAESADNTDTLSEETMTDTPFDQLGEPQAGEQIVTIQTNMGDIKIRMFTTKAPKTVENFTTHARNGYYDGVIFHRIINGFMIQGGDPEGTGRGGESIWGGSFADEFDADLKNIPYSLSMANAGPNTNGSQFFINQVDNGFLNGRHAVFGQVIDGKDVVEKIIAVETGAGDKPVEDVVMQAMIVEEVE